MLFPKSARLLKSREFRIVGKHGRRHSGQLLQSQILTHKRGANYPTRLGITVSKKYGNAVARNYFKRLVREAFRQCRADFPANTSISVRPQLSAKGQLSLEGLKAEFSQLAKSFENSV